MWSPLSSSPPRRGFTLVEVLLAAFIGVMLLGIIYQLVSFSRQASSTADQSYVLGQDAAKAFRTLQRELTETSLASIVVSTYKTASGDMPCVAMLSARQEGGLNLGPDGVPHWVREIQYRLEPSEKDTDTGTVVRREQDLPSGGLPFPQPVTGHLTSKESRPVLLGVLLPGKVVKPGKTGLAEVQADPEADGGFVVSFVRRDSLGHESLSSENPCSRSDDAHDRAWTQATTGLLDLSLGILEKDTSTGQLGYVQLQLRICPSHE